jgi:hypothetical protein
MFSKLSVAYLVAYICVTFIQYAHPPVVSQHPYIYLWAIASFSYPFSLAFTRTGTGFWKGLLMILLIPVIAQAFECVMYLWRTNGFQHGDTETVLFFGFYLIGPLSAAVVCYPIGYLASWLLLQRKAG